MTPKPHLEPSDSPLSWRDRYRGWAMLVVGILTGLVYLFLAYHVVPRFEGIYQDMLGNHPLPFLTVLVLHARWVYIGLAVLWPLLAVREFQHCSTWFPWAFAAVNASVVFITLTGLMQPLVTTIKQMSGEN